MEKTIIIISLLVYSSISLCFVSEYIKNDTNSDMNVTVNYFQLPIFGGPAPEVMLIKAGKDWSNMLNSVCPVKVVITGASNTLLAGKNMVYSHPMQMKTSSFGSTEYNCGDMSISIVPSGDGISAVPKKRSLSSYLPF